MKKIVNKLAAVITLTIFSIPFIAFGVQSFVEKRLINKNAENLELFKSYWDIEAQRQIDLKNEFDAKIKESLQNQIMLHDAAENSRQILRELCVGNESEKCKDVGLEFVDEIFFTSYNAHQSQTDDQPCIGASGYDQCKFVKKHRIIALSRDLVSYTDKTPFKYMDKVFLEQDLDDDRCNGEFVVMDTMNARYKKRGDIFFMNRKDNTSCHAKIYKIL